jgi:uncharacterized membrane protein
MKLAQLHESDRHLLERKVRITQWASRTSFIGLLIFFSAWYLAYMAINAHSLWSVWLLHTLPLISFTPFLINGSPRGHVWLCFILLIYFNGAVLMSAAGGVQLIAGLLYAVLVVTLFVSAMMYSRWASQLVRLNREATQTH